jgi:hypothetical protein
MRKDRRTREKGERGTGVEEGRGKAVAQGSKTQTHQSQSEENPKLNYMSATTLETHARRVVPKRQRLVDRASDTSRAGSSVGTPTGE